MECLYERHVEYGSAYYDNRIAHNELKILLFPPRTCVEYQSTVRELERGKSFELLSNNAYTHQGHCLYRVK